MLLQLRSRHPQTLPGGADTPSSFLINTKLPHSRTAMSSYVDWDHSYEQVNYEDLNVGN